MLFLLTHHYPQGTKNAILRSAQLLRAYKPVYQQNTGVPLMTLKLKHIMSAFLDIRWNNVSFKNKQHEQVSGCWFSHVVKRNKHILMEYTVSICKSACKLCITYSVWKGGNHMKFSCWKRKQFTENDYFENIKFKCAQ